MKDAKHLIAGFAVLVLQGWLFTFLWRWFIVPAIHAPEISAPVGIGLITTAAFVFGDSTKDVSLFDSVLFSLIAFTVGWLVHLTV